MSNTRHYLLTHPKERIYLLLDIKRTDDETFIGVIEKHPDQPTETSRDTLDMAAKLNMSVNAALTKVLHTNENIIEYAYTGYDYCELPDDCGELYQPGLKYNQGKPQPTLLHRSCHHAVSKIVDVLTFGANKYSADNWRKVSDIPTTYMDAAYRHLQAHLAGELKDPESGLPHLAHVAVNIIFLLEHQHTQTQETA